MSRSRRRPYHAVCVVNSSERKNKRIHNHRLRRKGRAFITKTLRDVDRDYVYEGTKKQEGLSLYLFNSDGGQLWMGYLKKLIPEDYEKIIRK